MDLSIIILNFNTQKLLDDLLTSIKNASKNLKTETIVVDNGSKDSSIKMIKRQYPWVILIENKTNLGFSGGINKGIRKAKGKYILLLNSDTRLFKDTLQRMIHFMDQNPQYAAGTCRVELASGELDSSCHRGFPTPWVALTYFIGLEKLFPRSKIFGQYHQGWHNLNKIHEVDVISGAFFMVRKSVLDKVGLFDEQYFMYGEDIDLCLRMKNKGYKISYYPEAKIIHFKKQSGRNKQDDLNINKQTTSHFYQTMKIFYDKHYQKKYSWIMKQLVFLGIRVINFLGIKK